MLDTGRQQALGAAIAAVVIAVGAVLFLRAKEVPMADLVLRLPREDRVLAFFDVAALRHAGILEKLRSSTAENEYRQFVEHTGFDYLSDLDTLLVAYGNHEAYLFVRGHFDLKRLRSYAESSGGSCHGRICRVNGSTPGVTIGFARVDARTLAVASSADPDAVERLLADPAGARPVEAPAEPVWFLLEPSILQERLLPPRAAMFATAALECQDVYLSLGARGDGQAGFLARLRAVCKSAAQAEQAVRELRAATTMLRRVLSQEQKQPDATELSGILARGEFEARQERLSGTWPIELAFLEALAR